MSICHAKPSDQAKNPCSYSESRGKRPQGIKKEQVQRRVCRSAPLSTAYALDKSSDESYLLPNDVPSGKSPQHQTAALQTNDRKRKQHQEVNDELLSTSPRKRLRASHTDPDEVSSGVKATGCTTEDIDPIDHWRKEGSWPKEYFEADDRTREYLNRDIEEEIWLKTYYIPEMERLLARKRSASSLYPIQAQPGSSIPATPTPSDQKPREQKSATYRHAGYTILLGTKGSFMNKDKEGPRKESKDLCRNLLELGQSVPDLARFSDHVFESTCQRIQGKNEAKVIQDITRLIVPSAEGLADFGAEHLEHLVESVNEGWNNSIPVTKPRPQPDYAVGFGRSAFTEEQLNKLEPFVGGLTDTSYFMATYYMYFPFLTCEVKCGAAALDIADRQNAHSMTVAVRAIVELFQLVKREKDVDREILSFSISHDHESVRIYGHYPVIGASKTTFYRYPIHKFYFTELDGREKWTAYKFTKNVYDSWMPTHLKRILSAIDEIPPNVNFGLSQSASFSQEPQPTQQSSSSVVMLEDDSQPSLVGSQDVTPNTSFTDQQQFKKPRSKRAAEWLYLLYKLDAILSI